MRSSDSVAAKSYAASHECRGGRGCGWVANQ